MTIITASNAGTLGPLQAHASGRFLVDGAGRPFLLIGDSPQGLLACLLPTDMKTYMANRQSHGINTLQVHLMAGVDFGGNSTTFETVDGIHPFTVDGDISTPNAAYFARVDAMLALAANHGMVVMLTAAEHIDAAGLFADLTKCANFGAYLGQRYAGMPNIIWDFGNDMPTADAHNPYFQAVSDGIKMQDTNHLHTAWLGGVPYALPSRANSGWNSRVGLDMGYTYSPPYIQMLSEYALVPAMPVILGESNYESESLIGYLTTPYIIRLQAYWTMFAGACGHVYCNGPDTYRFASGWETRLDSYPGLTHVGYLTALLTARPWWTMVPDTGHAILTAGYGTQEVSYANDINTNDFAPCAALGSGCLIYMPTNRTMTVNLSGTRTARWFDPTAGTYAVDAASPVSSWPHNFNHAGANAAGDPDWALVIE